MAEHTIITEVVTKKCNHCDEEKPLSAFCKRAGRLDGLHGTCRLCHREHAKKYRETHPKFREWERKYYQKHREKSIETSYICQLKRNYGLTLEDYNRILKAQNGVCAICGKINKNGSRLMVDHDHETGKVRGLLCKKCNLGLGLFDDNREYFEAALYYLKQFSVTKLLVQKL